uniref:hypothetical protein n=1 Tax=Cupriavidus taiwanensis TaxID=164546 RepID=UPI001331A98D|nr:hypothetical protein [Cupriavidus taiwanensis]
MSPLIVVLGRFRTRPHDTASLVGTGLKIAVLSGIQPIGIAAPTYFEVAHQQLSD